MAAVSEMQPQRENVYRPQLELRNQLREQHKYVKIEGTDEVYLMVFDDETNRQEASTLDTPQTPDGTSVSNCIYVQKSLGYGGFGIVYKAELMTPKDQKICIKMGLHKRKYHNGKERLQGQLKVNKRLLVEAKHYRKLSQRQHPNIISMQFSCISQDFQEAFLVLSSCKGTDLSKLLKHYGARKLSTKMLRKIMIESTRAVQYCWSHRIVHCDIKPPNILFLSMNEPLKLIDFGCAIDLDEDFDLDKTVAGTFEYMAPEMLIHGLPGVNEHSDIYSLGAVFYEFIIRQRPWLHHEKFSKVRREEKKALIEKEHKAYEEYLEQFDDGGRNNDQLKHTPLQANLTKTVTEIYSKEPTDYHLLMAMLSHLPDKRPSCAKIILEVSGEFAQRKAVLYEGSRESSSAFAMPGSSNQTSQSGQRTTISTAAHEFMDLNLKSVSGEEYNPYYDGEMSAESLIGEEVKSDYASALGDEAEATQERLQRMMEDMEIHLSEISVQHTTYSESSQEEDLSNFDIEQDMQQLVMESMQLKPKHLRWNNLEGEATPKKKAKRGSDEF